MSIIYSKCISSKWWSTFNSPSNFSKMFVHLSQCEMMDTSWQERHVCLQEIQWGQRKQNSVLLTVCFTPSRYDLWTEFCLQQKSLRFKSQLCRSLEWSLHLFFHAWLFLGYFLPLSKTMPVRLTDESKLISGVSVSMNGCVTDPVIDYSECLLLSSHQQLAPPPPHSDTL